jgi:mRNA interferase RelE/StbE
MVGPGARQFKISKQAQKFIVSLPEDQRERIKEAISRLIAGDLSQLDIKKLAPHQHEYRLRVGKIRILFWADSEGLFIFKAGFRGDVYG